MFQELEIRSGGHEIIKFEDLQKILLDLVGQEYTFAVGTDSQPHKKAKSTTFVTCLVAHNPNRGARFWYVKEKVKDKSLQMPENMQKRLMYEVMRSIWAAIEVEEAIGLSPSVHLDFGTDPLKSKSAKWVAELTNMVISQGYKCAVKPYSWASDCADRFTKN